MWVERGVGGIEESKSGGGEEGGGGDKAGVEGRGGGRGRRACGGPRLTCERNMTVSAPCVSVCQHVCSSSLGPKPFGN